MTNKKGDTDMRMTIKRKTNDPQDAEALRRVKDMIEDYLYYSRFDPNQDLAVHMYGQTFSVGRASYRVNNNEGWDNGRGAVYVYRRERAGKYSLVGWVALY